MKDFFKNSFPFLLAGLAIGILVVLQLKSDTAYVSSYPLDEYELQQELIDIFQAEQTELEELLNDLSAEVEEAQAEAALASSTADSEDLNALKKQLGLTEVSGQGVVIQLQDKEGVSRKDINVDINQIINASDLRDVVNILREFTYEAITINGQRIVYSSPISSAGNNVLVNNFQISPPFEIEIITTIPESVMQKLTAEETLSSLSGRVQTSEIIFKFKKEEFLSAPAYIGGYRTNFLTAPNE